MDACVYAMQKPIPVCQIWAKNNALLQTNIANKARRVRHFGNHAVFFCCPSGKSCHPWCKICNVLAGKTCANSLCCTANFATRVAVFHIFARFFLHTPVCFAQRRCMRAFFLPHVSPFLATFGLQLLHGVFNFVMSCSARIVRHATAQPLVLPCLLRVLFVARVLSKQLCFPLCSSICWQIFSVNSRCGCIFRCHMRRYFVFQISLVARPLLGQSCHKRRCVLLVVWCVAFANFCTENARRCQFPLFSLGATMPSFFVACSHKMPSLPVLVQSSISLPLYRKTRPLFLPFLQIQK